MAMKSRITWCLIGINIGVAHDLRVALESSQIPRLPQSGLSGRPITF